MVRKQENRKESVMGKISKKIVSIVATLAMFTTMVPAASIAFAAESERIPTDVVNVYGADEITSYTHRIFRSGAYYVAEDTNIDPSDTYGNGIKIDENLDVVIYIPRGVTLTVAGQDGYLADDVGYAAIYLPESSTLTITGGGTINALGGDAGAGSRGCNGKAAIYDDDSDGGPYYYGGNGGIGGDGGAGAGAGIGTNGGIGGLGGLGGDGKKSEGFYSEDGAGEDGQNGEAGESALAAGDVYFAGSLTVNCQGGKAQTTQSVGGSAGANYLRKNAWFAYSTCGGAGGGAGASGESAYGIGSGGDGGAGGAGGGGGGHYRDGVGGSSYIGYYYCGGEGGKGATAVEGGANGSDGEASPAITEDMLGTKYTSKAGIAGTSTAGSVKSEYIAYKNTTTGSECKFKYDEKDYIIPSVKYFFDAEEFADKGGYTSTLTIDANNGTYADDAKTYKINIVPGADPVSDLYDIMTSTNNAVSPLRTGYALVGYSTTDATDNQFFKRIEDGETISGEWTPSGTDNALCQEGYVVGNLGTEDDYLKTAVLTNFTPGTLYAVWQANDYTVTYNRNETLLNTLGIKTMPNWVSTSDTTKTKTTVETTDTGFTYDTESKLAISSSMHSTDKIAFPSNQNYYLESANNGQYVLKGWTKSINEKGEATDTIYSCGEAVTRLTSDNAVTLYAVWGTPSDINSPAFVVDPDLTLPFEYSADASKLNVRAVPYWGTNSKGEYGSYFVAAIYGENPSRTLSTEWQMYDESTSQWKAISTNGAYGGYKSAIDETAFTEDFTYNGAEYKAGEYTNRALKATLTIPRGAAAGTSNKYRCVFKLSAVTGSASADSLEYVSPAITFKVIKADYDTSEIKILNRFNHVITTNLWKTTYTGAEQGFTITGLPAKLTAHISYYSESEAKYIDTAPIEPGTYYAHITYSNSDVGYNTPEERVIKIVISKAQVFSPVPKELTYKIADYTTGEAAVQTAFDENDLYYADNASASQAGDYVATFTLKDTKRYEWIVGTGSTKQMYYTIAPLKVKISSDEITVGDESYSITWQGTTSNYDGKVHSASITSSLFGNGSSEGKIPDWVTGWKDGKPSSKTSAYYVYYVDNGDGTFTNVVGYDVNGNVITKEQIEAWKSGSSSSSVTAKSFSDVAEFGVKSSSVVQVSIAFDTSDSNVKISGTSTSPFTIAPAGVTPVLLSSKATDVDGKTKYVPAPSYKDESGKIVEGLPTGVKSVTFYEWDTSTGAWKTDVWGKYNYDGTMTGGINVPASEDVKLKAVFEMTDASYTQLNYQVLTFNVELAGGIIAVPTAAQNLVYNGSAQSGIEESDAYTLSGDKSGIDAGTYSTIVTPASGYLWADGTSTPVTVTWSISKKPIAAPTAVSGLVYTGESQTGVAGGEGYTVAGGSQVNAGDHTATVTLLSNNYKWINSDKEDTFEIVWSIAKQEIAVPQAKTDLTYKANKEQQGVPFANGYYLEGATAIDAGGYVAVATLDGNHIWPGGDTSKKYISWSISPKRIDIPTAIEGLVYNGKEQTGVVAGEGYSLSGTTAATEVGDYEATVSLFESGNYIWSDYTTNDKTIKWSIAEAPTDVPVDVPSAQSFTYNGTEQTGVAENDAYSIHGTAKATNAGTYSATLVLNDGYVWSDGSGDKAKDVVWTISKAKTSVKVTKKVKTAKRAKLAKKAIKLKVITVNGLPSNATISFAKVKNGSAKKAYKALKINAKTGKVTVKKGSAKGTYKLKVKISVVGANYITFTKTITIKVKVK